MIKDSLIIILLIFLILLTLAIYIGIGVGTVWVLLWLLFKITGIYLLDKLWYIYLFWVLMSSGLPRFYINKKGE